MRSSQVYRALDSVPNRYTLCQTISQSARRIHINGNPFESTVTVVLKGIGDGLFRGQVESCLRRDGSNTAPHESPEGAFSSMLPSVDVATYERILKNLAQTRVTIHCTITGQIAGRPGYLEEFLPFWTNRPEARKVWMSIFTPQQGATGPAILSPSVRVAVIAELLRLPPLYPILG